MGELYRWNGDDSWCLCALCQPQFRPNHFFNGERCPRCSAGELEIKDLTSGLLICSLACGYVIDAMVSEK